MRTGKLQRQQLRLNELTEALSKKQLELIAKNELTHQQARVTADLIVTGNDWWFTLTNVGTGVAMDVKFELIDCPDSPLIAGDFDSKLPIPLLQPDQTLRLIAARNFGSPTSYTAKVSWTDPDGTWREDVYHLSI
jgi:hypothetical protein